MNIKFLFLTIFLIFCCFFPQLISAYTVEELNFSVEGDIVVGPGKTELYLDPGGQYTQEIIVSNRSGVDKIIDISVEDFESSNDADEVLKFLGGGVGPYSLKDYVKPEINQITLKHGQRLRLPVTISIPKDAEPGGLYGAAMISASNVGDLGDGVEAGTAGSKIKVVTRVASLFFVRVNGEVLENGALKEFTTNKNFYEKGPIAFSVTFENTGSVHLSPSGSIEIKNILGTEISKVNLDSWFVMPQSERTKQAKWSSDFLMGKYTAILTLDKGFNGLTETKEISFWVIPWKLLSMVAIGLILFIFFIVWLASHLQFKKDVPLNPPPANYPPPPVPPVAN